MEIDRRRIRRLATLAGLELDPGEEERLAAELGRILEYVERIGEVENAPEPPSPAPREEADEPRPPLPRERALAAALLVEDGLVQVPAPRPVAGKRGDGGDR